LNQNPTDLGIPDESVSSEDALARRFAMDKGLMSLDDLQAIGLRPTRRQQDDTIPRQQGCAIPFADGWI